MLMFTCIKSDKGTIFNGYNQTPIINSFIYNVHFEQQPAIESAADGTFLDDIVADDADVNGFKYERKLIAFCLVEQFDFERI